MFLNPSKYVLDFWSKLIDHRFICPLNILICLRFFSFFCIHENYKLRFLWPLGLLTKEKNKKGPKKLSLAQEARNSGLWTLLVRKLSILILNRKNSDVFHFWSWFGMKVPLNQMIHIFEVAFYSDNHYFKKQNILKFVYITFISFEYSNYIIFYPFKRIIDWDTLLSVYAYRLKAEV